MEGMSMEAEKGLKEGDGSEASPALRATEPLFCPQCGPEGLCRTCQDAQGDEVTALRNALKKLDRACQDLGHDALPAWDYNPPAYLRGSWEKLADVLVEIGPLLQAQSQD